jgi:hypothetical protein
MAAATARCLPRKRSVNIEEVVAVLFAAGAVTALLCENHSRGFGEGEIGRIFV